MVCVYDSGVGGLTALRALRRAAPRCDVVYFGDTARVPYGVRDDATVSRYAREVLDYLAALSPSAVLVACGTVSTVFLPRAHGRYPFPIFGIAEAGIRAAVAAAPSGRIAVLGTEATVRSGYFDRRIRALFPHAEVTSLACPLFVALAECGYTAADDPIARVATETLLSPLLAKRPEAILLGCTHFPWLAAQIARLFPEAALIDPSAEAVAELAPLLADEVGRGKTEYLVTDGADSFLRAAHRMTGTAVGETVREVSLTV